MKIGVIVPSFSWGVDEAIEVSRAADEAGVDGVFAYDHLWPMNNRSRPAVAPFPLLAALAQRFPRLSVGPLVARIGLVENAVLEAQVRALNAIAPGRVIAALGTGDSMSAEENHAYGVAFASASERRAALESCAVVLRDEGLEVWIGGGAAPTIEIAERNGVALNLWQASVEDVARRATSCAVTWAGLAPEDDEELAALSTSLREAGATWAVFGNVGAPGRLQDLSRT